MVLSIPDIKGKANVHYKIRFFFGRSGRFGISHLLQVMSPKMQSLQDMDMEIITADQNRNYGGSSNHPFVEVPVPVFQGGGQELAQRQPHDIAVAETPEKKVLKKQVSELVEA